MELRPDQLDQHLAGELAPVYRVSGDEPLQHTEVGDAIRAAARARGYSVREVHEARADFEWSRLTEAGSNLSLFGDGRLVDLRLPTGRPGREGGAVLKAWAQKPPEDAVLLVTTPRLERDVLKSAWCRALDAAGVAITLHLPERGQLPRWIEHRMQARGLQPDREAVTLLADRIEGNLVAAAQEIDKLLLLHGPGPVDSDAVATAVADSTRFGPFDLGDAVVDGEPERLARIAAGLRAEGVAPPLALWALHREIELLATVAARCAGGESRSAAVRAAGVWQRRQDRVARAVTRMPANAWARLLVGCARLDRVAKGAERGSFWEELVELGLTAAGAPMPELTPRSLSDTP